MKTPDFRAYRSRTNIIEVNVINLGIKVRFDNGETGEFHKLMLRENAPDSETTHPITREQQLQLVEINSDLTISSAEVSSDGNLEIIFSPESLKVTYQADWLYYWLTQGKMKYRPELPEFILWGSKIGGEMFDRGLIFDSGEIRSDNTKRKEWLGCIHQYGFAVSKYWPKNNSTVQTVANLIGPIRESNFGKTFDVHTKADADSNAYASMGLPVHTDLCTREYLPGLQILHCLENDAHGGETILVDGFMLADLLKKTAPEEYFTLTTHLFPAANKAKDSDYRTALPVFQLDENGTVKEVRVNPWLRAPMAHSIEEVDKAYKALKLLFEKSRSKDLEVVFKLMPGDVIVFDNRRLLHGRTEIHLDNGVSRHLRGCYLEREELHSQLLVQEFNELK